MRAKPCRQETHALCLHHLCIHACKRLHQRKKRFFFEERLFKMPKSCCAVGCTNRQTKENANLHFHSIPKGITPFQKRRRDDWIRAIRRKNWADEQISKALICSEHIVSGINHSFITHRKACGI